MDPILDAPFNYQRALSYAGFWIRVAAYLIDSVLLSVVNYIISFAINPSGDLEGAYMPMGVNLIINVIYFAAMESSEKQGTLGKMAVGIKVCDLDGEKISFANGVGRFLAKMLSFLILLIGVIMVALDQKKQGLHDKIANTYVIY